MAARKARLSQSWPWGVRLLLGSCGLPLLGAGAAQAQACPPGPVAVNGTSCVVPLGSTITVISAATPGLRATNPGGQISANSVTINLGPGAAPRNYIGAEAVDGGVINFDGSTLATVQAATGQRGLVSSGAGSHISANGANITLGTGAVAVTDNLAILASGGGTVFALAANFATLGGGNGSSNHAVVATGTGSRIDLVGGTVSTASRGSFGVLAQGGGMSWPTRPRSPPPALRSLPETSAVMPCSPPARGARSSGPVLRCPRPAHLRAPPGPRSAARFRSPAARSPRAAPPAQTLIPRQPYAYSPEARPRW